MVDYLKSTKDDRKRDEENQKEETNLFYERVETKELFDRYEKGLRQFYKFYATQDTQ